VTVDDLLDEQIEKQVQRAACSVQRAASDAQPFAPADLLRLASPAFAGS
jgi:hypothetical protein